ncbi:mitochondrial amino-acid acetyltransferase [Calycina marina]|uniref:Amino-acid acetyltransferase, mitochondrial n=1 Tax=Calycina marina TaxID=1763456 RepID=A0A9P7YX28_9HELO|nr:mitochondrial amino-acid acetyltransferase [Calycina marina]
MNLSNTALKKGKEVAGHNIQLWTRQKLMVEYGKNGHRRYSLSARAASGQLRDELAKEHVRDLSSKQKAKKEAKASDRDFFISVLGSSATKRDARAYIQQFTPPKDKSLPTAKASSEASIPRPSRNLVNLGLLYGPARAVAESPKFVQRPLEELPIAQQTQLHIALVRIRAAETLDNDTLRGIGRTLSQLNRLGLTSIVVVDGPGETCHPNWRSGSEQQAGRIVDAIDLNGGAGARFVNNALGTRAGIRSHDLKEWSIQVMLGTNVCVVMEELLMTPLKRGIIPVIPCTVYTGTEATSRGACEVILALTRHLGYLDCITATPTISPRLAEAQLRSLPKEVLLDRLIVLDPLGGIPSTDCENGYHVFLNMEQEYDAALDNLQDVRGLRPEHRISHNEKIQHHMQNLFTARRVLSFLPPNSSALITTPEAANSGREPDTPFQAAGVGTRRQRNPLIHNLLTDKPVFSSSLPMGRIGHSSTLNADSVVTSPTPIIPTTFAKHGMCVTMFPDPSTEPWEPPRAGVPQLKLTDARINYRRLVHLIEDSFGRKLDVEDYLKRVNDRIAGVIIAGEYEGGAIMTWELPPGIPDDGSASSRARMVPYLDKFAVSKKSQGSGGTADVVFKAMVRDCFPGGVCWRSRKTNVVNKWYFERSRGTWKLPDSGWAMFWTTPDLIGGPQKFKDYEGVCRNIEPSWADSKALLD